MGHFYLFALWLSIYWTNVRNRVASVEQTKSPVMLAIGQNNDATGWTMTREARSRWEPRTTLTLRLYVVLPEAHACTLFRYVNGINVFFFFSTTRYRVLDIRKKLWESLTLTSTKRAWPRYTTVRGADAIDKAVDADSICDHIIPRQL